MTGAPHITLLQISDLQFGRYHRFEGEPGFGSLLDRIIQDTDKLAETEGIRPDLVLLTGDLSEWAMDSELDQVRRFAEGLRDRLRLSTRRIVMLPGNHDINRKLCEGYFAMCEGRGKKPVAPYFPKYEPFTEMFTRFYTGEPDIAFTEKEPWTFFECPDLRVVVAALNSTLADSHRAEDHYGLVGEPQLRWFIEKLRPYRERGWLRIAAVHHDILLPEVEAAKQDKLDIENMLAPWVNLVLHGHTHVEQVQWLDGKTPVPVLGIGSAGVKVAERPAEVPNQYQVVKVFADHIEYGRRAYLPDKKRWAGCLRSDPEGNAWKLERQVAFERVEATFEAGATPGPAPKTDLAALIEKYREAWAKAESRVGLFDIAARGEDEDVARGLDMLNVFVPPKARREPMARSLDPWEREGEELPPRLRRKGRRRLDAERVSERYELVGGGPEPIEHLLMSPDLPWIAVLGAPGAGKTALTRWLGLKLCVAGEAVGEGMRDMVPVRIELRQFAEAQRCAKEAGRAYDFFEYVDESYRERSIDLRGEPLRELAEAGRILWLFDGLDEVPDANRRRDIAKMIGGIRMKYGGRGVVTSRMAGASPALPVLEQAGLTAYTLVDFDDEEIEAFVERWHAHAFPGAPDVAEKRKERLRRTLRESRPVRELVKNPLLLTLVALLNRGAELPRRRHLIYEEVVSLMAERWEANKHRVNGVGRLDGVQKKKLLRQVAWRMMTELPDGAGNVIHEEDLLDTVSGFCERELGEEQERAKSTARGIIDELRERNGLLTLLGGRLFGFLHKTLLEYFTAVEVVGRFRSRTWEMEQVKELFREHWDQQEWEEVLWLICGMIQDDRPAYMVELVQAVIEKVGPFRRPSTSVAFAIRCLGEVRDMQQEPVRSMALVLTDVAMFTTKVSPSYQFDHNGSGFLANGEIIRAVRFSGKEWPGNAKFMRATKRAQTKHAQDIDSTALICASATVPRSDRLRFIQEIIEDGQYTELLVHMLKELSYDWAWTCQDAELVLHLVEKSAPEQIANVLALFLREGVMGDLSRLARIATNVDIHQQHAADLATAMLATPEFNKIGHDLWLRLFDFGGLSWFLMNPQKHWLVATSSYPELRSRFKEMMNNDSANLIDANALYMALAWRDEPLLRRWFDALFRGDDTFLVFAYDLYREARVWPPARRLLYEIFENLVSLPASRWRLVFAELLNRLDPTLGQRHLRALLEVDEPWIATEAASLIAMSSESKSEMIALLSKWSSEPDKTRSKTALDLLSSIATENSEARQIVMGFAQADWRSFSERITMLEPLSRQFDLDSIRLMEHLAMTAINDNDRVRAAKILQEIGGSPTTWRPVLEYLSRSAKTGALRLEAAKALRDEERIEQLSRKAKKREVRLEAAQALEALRLHKAILAVGKKRRGRVSVNGTLAGHIEETDAGTRFTYDPSYLARRGAQPLSPTLPLRKEPYDSPGIHPFFENLLPEGWLLDITCRKLGMERTDPFGLLLATCRDCAGSVEIAPDDADHPVRPARPKRPARSTLPTRSERRSPPKRTQRKAA